MAIDPNSAADAAPHLSTEEARAGATPHMTRYVLGWGLGLIVLVFAIVVGIFMFRT